MNNPTSTPSDQTTWQGVARYANLPAEIVNGMVRRLGDTIDEITLTEAGNDPDRASWTFPVLTVSHVTDPGAAPKVDDYQALIGQVPEGACVITVVWSRNVGQPTSAPSAPPLDPEWTTALTSTVD